MLLSKIATIRWHNKIKRWYEEKDYKWTKSGDDFEVKVEDLTNGSNALVLVQCDECDEILKPMPWNVYKKCVHKDGKYYCQKCSMKLYGSEKYRISRLKNSKSFEQWCYDNLSKKEAEEILSRWDYEKNIDKNGKIIKPSDISYSSNGKNYWFKCLKHSDHKSELKNINSFTNMHKSSLDCNQCNSFKQWCTENNRQDVLVRWDYKLNINKPDEISYGTKNKYYFKCPRNIHSSELKIINSFTNGQEGSIKCNQCNSFEQWCIDNNHQDWLDLWDYELNNIKPSNINYSTKNKYYFKCPRGIHKSELKQISAFTSKSICNIKCNICNSFAQWGIDTYGQNFLEKYWSNKNIISPWEIPKASNKKVWIKCENKKHKDYKRSANECKRYDLRCPKCVEKRTESILQEKVRLYLKDLKYEVLHEYNTLKCINPKTNHILPYDNEIKDLKLIIEVHGTQHYNITGLSKLSAIKNNTTPEQELHKIQLYDRYKRIFAKLQGYYYLEIPYWKDNEKEDWKQLINNKIKEISI